MYCHKLFLYVILSIYDKNIEVGKMLIVLCTLVFCLSDGCF